MKEVKPSKKPLAIYYAIVLAVLLLLNLVLLPWMSERQVEEVDYGTFMTIFVEQSFYFVHSQQRRGVADRFGETAYAVSYTHLKTVWLSVKWWMPIVKPIIYRWTYERGNGL